MELEPIPVGRLSFGMLEPMDPELLSLLASTKDDSSTSSTLTATPKSIDADATMQLAVDDMMPLHLVVSTPTGVEAYNPGFSTVEMQDLMTLLLPERPATASAAPHPRVAKETQPKKLASKRAKKCTYAARRREVAALRSEAASLEAALAALRRARGDGGGWQQRAADEQDALDKSQAENARLRGAVSAREATIRTLDSYLSSLSRQR